MFKLLRGSKFGFQPSVKPAVLRHRNSSVSSFSHSLRQHSNSHNNGKNQLPKLRYFFLIMALGSAAFVGSLQLVGDKKTKGELSEADYEKIKAKRAATAFDPKDTFVVFVLGGPGSGKGTQCDKIINDYNFAHLSAGDLLRAEQRRPGSEYGDLIKSYIKDGKIVPQEITIALLKNAMSEAKAKGVNHFLIDGFPRKMDQALTFEEKVVPSRFTLFFQCPESVMLDRVLKRGKTSGRTDDNVDSMRERFATFVNQSMPVVEYFNTAGKVTTLQCDKSIDEVYATVQETLKAHHVYPSH